MYDFYIEIVPVNKSCKSFLLSCLDRAPSIQMLMRCFRSIPNCRVFESTKSKISFPLVVSLNSSQKKYLLVNLPSEIIRIYAIIVCRNKGICLNFSAIYESSIVSAAAIKTGDTTVSASEYSFFCFTRI